SILLIDDDPDLTDFLQRELRAHGHRVTCLDCAEPGPELLAGSAFDLVLLDNKMPGMSGIEFLEALRERGLEPQVILMTGHAAMDTAIQAMSLGAFDYVDKGDDFRTLYRKLERMIAEALQIAHPVKQVRLPEEAQPSPSAGPVLIGGSPEIIQVWKLIG